MSWLMIPCFDIIQTETSNETDYLLLFQLIFGLRLAFCENVYF